MVEEVLEVISRLLRFVDPVLRLLFGFRYGRVWILLLLLILLLLCLLLLRLLLLRIVREGCIVAAGADAEVAWRAHVDRHTVGCRRSGAQRKIGHFSVIGDDRLRGGDDVIVGRFVAVDDDVRAADLRTLLINDVLAVRAEDDVAQDSGRLALVRR